MWKWLSDAKKEQARVAQKRRTSMQALDHGLSATGDAESGGEQSPSTGSSTTVGFVSARHHPAMAPHS